MGCIGVAGAKLHCNKNAGSVAMPDPKAWTPAPLRGRSDRPGSNGAPETALPGVLDNSV